MQADKDYRYHYIKVSGHYDTAHQEYKFAQRRFVAGLPSLVWVAACDFFRCAHVIGVVLFQAR